MLVTLEVGHAEFDFLELEGRFELEQIAEGLQSIFGGLGLLRVNVLQHLCPVDVVRADLDQLFLDAFHVLKHAVVEDIDAKVVFDIDFLLDFIKFEVVHSAH